MTKSLAKPRPVRVGRYRYSKLRWRLLVHALDFGGSILMAVVRTDPTGARGLLLRAGSWSCNSTIWAMRCLARP